MSAKDLLELSVALRDFGRVRLDELRGRVDTELAKRIEDMTLSPPVAPPGATPAGVRAAFVHRRISLEEDLETISLLAKDSRNLTAEDQVRRTAALRKALSHTTVKLVEVMRHGTEEKAPHLIAKGVEVARLAYGLHLKLNPQQPSDFETFLTDALLTQDKASLLEAEYVVIGQVQKEGIYGTEKDGNDVYLAVQRQVDEADTKSNREARNVQLFRRALGYAIRPKWTEKPDKRETISSLFGDGNVWPTAEVQALRAELATGKYEVRDKVTGEVSGRRWDPATVTECKELLTLFEGLLALSIPNGMTQQEATRLTKPLGESLKAHRLYEWLGNEKMYHTLDLASLEALNPQARAVKLRQMVASARIALQRRILDDVNLGHHNATTNYQKHQDQQARMARNAAALRLEKEREAAKRS